MILRKIYYRLSPNLRFVVRKLLYLPIDTFESISGNRPKYVPPKGDIFIGSGDFIKQGNHHLELLKKHLNLKQNDSVLDMGCGMGRTALPLTKYLNSTARYEGFDVVKKAIEWCNSGIKKDFPNFNFTHIPLHNDLYLKSEGQASNFVFPYKDQCFDKVFLFSVFTHMQITEIENYLKEINRVLKPKGLCMATFFIYDDQTEKKISKQKNFNFPIQKKGYRLMDAQVKSANIAIEKVNLENIIFSSGLKIIKLIEGYWENGFKKQEIDFQDILILDKSK